MELDGANFVDAVLDHLRVEAVDFTFLGHGHFPKIFQHEWNDRFCRGCRYDGATVAHGLGEVRQRAAMIQVEVSHKDGINDMSEV